MAKTATPTTLPPSRFSSPGPIILEDVVALIEMQNHLASEECHTLLSFMSATQGLDGAAGSNIRAHRGVWWRDEAGGWSRVYYGRTYVDPDMQFIRVDVGVTLQTDDLGDVRVTIGGGQIAFAFAATGGGAVVQIARSGGIPVNGERLTDSGQLDVATVGTGWVDVEIEINPNGTTGAWGSFLAGLDHITVQGVKVAAADLPDPD